MEFFIITLIKAGLIAGVLLTGLAYLPWLERKVIAHVQSRMGPSRVGPHGLMQPLADLIKFLSKEDLIPAHVNKFYYVLAPFLATALALTSISVVPFGPQIDVFGWKTNMGMTDLNIGVVFILAVSSVGVYGIALGGWASNNKYALLGALRSSAQMISYELPMALAIAAPLLMVNTLNLRAIVEKQQGSMLDWNLLHGPFPQVFGFIIFMIAAFAETNRIPFDLPEAENELVAGFHTEYSSMKFALFFMAEYGNMVTVCCMATILFLGGWNPIWPSEYGSNFVATLLFGGAAAIMFYHGFNPARPKDRITLPIFGTVFAGIALVFQVPFLAPALQPLFWYSLKVGFLLFLFIWIRATLPRFRYDQLMRFAWLFLFPVAMVNLLVTGFLVALFTK